MSAQFTQEDKDYLYQIFANGDHEVREGATTKTGKVQWFIYLTWEAIQIHLDERFFGEWSDEYHSHRDLDGYSETYCRITIRGMCRENNGSNSANSKSDENQGKGAATDAFKRCAAKWGIGLYLREAPRVYTAYDYKDGNKIDYNKKAQREQEALKEFYKWLETLRRAQSTPSNVRELPKQEIIDKAENPSEVNHKQWSDDVKKLVAPLYIDANGKPNPFHMKGSLNKAFEDKVISYSMRPFVAALHMLAHRAKNDYGLEVADLQAIFGGQLGEIVKETPQDFASAWDSIRNEALALGATS